MPKLHPAYVAGIIDGEGCFNIHRNSNRVSYTPRLMLGMVDPRVPTALQATYGGSLIHVPSRSANSRDSWMWYATARILDVVLADVLDFLVVKRQQAELCLELHRSNAMRLHIVKGKKGIQRVSPEVLEYRERLKQQINRLNKVGKAA